MENIQQTEPKPRQLRALIVDDSRPTRRVLRAALTQQGFEVEEAQDGAAAAGILRKGIDRFDIIFSDISMPEMDGFELCQHLQEAPWYDGTPFVVVSTSSDATNVVRALKLGADDFIPKPFDPEIVDRVTRRVLAVV